MVLITSRAWCGLVMLVGGVIAGLCYGKAKPCKTALTKFDRRSLRHSSTVQHSGGFRSCPALVLFCDVGA